MVTQQTAIETAKAFIHDCEATGLVFDQVVIFGSYAQGNAHEASDINLLMVSPKFTDDLFANLRLYSKININYPLIETHPLRSGRLKDAVEFIKKISRQGIRIK